MAATPFAQAVLSGVLPSYPAPGTAQRAILVDCNFYKIFPIAAFAMPDKFPRCSDPQAMRGIGQGRS